MGVAVHGHRDGRVPEVDLDGFGVGAGGDQQAGAGVTEIVNAESLWEVGLQPPRGVSVPGCILVEPGDPGSGTTSPVSTRPSVPGYAE